MRDIVLWPDPRLSTPCAPVGSEDVSHLVTEMFEVMYAAPGRGLAAPQIGVLKRIFVMDCGWKEGDMIPDYIVSREDAKGSAADNSASGCQRKVQPP